MPQRPRSPDSTGKVVELFAGVGGFRLGLEAAGWEVTWANQWEPSTKTQHAFDCYVSHFTSGVHVNEDINLVLDQIDAGEREPIPDHDLLVGGFPCQDYSVAKTLNQAHGIEGKKGVLWWSIYRILEDKRPRLVFLENVDRLLKSPADQRGRDFAIILACLSDLGYMVEWAGRERCRIWIPSATAARFSSSPTTSTRAITHNGMVRFPGC